MQIRVYAVTKTNGKWDVLNKSNVIPKTIQTVHITWGSGKETMEVTREAFLASFTHKNGCYWEGEIALPKKEVNTSRVDTLKKALIEAEEKSYKCMNRRSALPVGSTRARVTTANARWMAACEHRDHLRNKITELEAAQ